MWKAEDKAGQIDCGGCTPSPARHVPHNPKRWKADDKLEQIYRSSGGMGEPDMADLTKVDACKVENSSVVSFTPFEETHKQLTNNLVGIEGKYVAILDKPKTEDSTIADIHACAYSDIDAFFQNWKKATPPFDLLDVKVPASGLKWTQVDANASLQPEDELKDVSALSDALGGGTRKFTQSTWDDFGIDRLHMDNFVRAGQTRFKPVESQTEDQVNFTLEGYVSARGCEGINKPPARGRIPGFLNFIPENEVWQLKGAHTLRELTQQLTDHPDSYEPWLEQQYSKVELRRVDGSAGSDNDGVYWSPCGYMKLTKVSIANSDLFGDFQKEKRKALSEMVTRWKLETTGLQALGSMSLSTIKMVWNQITGWVQDLLPKMKGDTSVQTRLASVIDKMNIEYGDLPIVPLLANYAEERYGPIPHSRHLTEKIIAYMIRQSMALSPRYVTEHDIGVERVFPLTQLLHFLPQDSKSIMGFDHVKFAMGKLLAFVGEGILAGWGQGPGTLFSHILYNLSWVEPGSNVFLGVTVGGVATTCLSVILASWTITCFTRHARHAIEHENAQRSLRMALPKQWIDLETFPSTFHRVIESCMSCTVEERVANTRDCGILGRSSLEEGARPLVTLSPCESLERSNVYCEIKGPRLRLNRELFFVFWLNEAPSVEPGEERYASVELKNGHLWIQERPQDQSMKKGTFVCFAIDHGLDAKPSIQMDKCIDSFVGSVTHIRGLEVLGKTHSRTALKEELKDKLRLMVFLSNCALGGADMQCALASYSPVRHVRLFVKHDTSLLSKKTPIFRRFCQTTSEQYPSGRDQNIRLDYKPVNVTFQPRSIQPKEASGLKWKEVGAEKPADCDELTNEQLSTALEGKTEFTKKEWEAFGIKDLRMKHVVKAGDRYFKPTEEAQTYEKQWTSCQPAHWQKWRYPSQVCRSEFGPSATAVDTEWSDQKNDCGKQGGQWWTAKFECNVPIG